MFVVMLKVCDGCQSLVSNEFDGTCDGANQSLVLFIYARNDIPSGHVVFEASF